MKYTTGWESTRKKASILRERYGYQFPRISQFDGFAAFSYAMGNWWGSPCISHKMKYTTGWETNGKKAPILSKSMSTNFPGFPHSMGFLQNPVKYIRAIGKLMGKPMHFPYDEIPYFFSCVCNLFALINVLYQLRGRKRCISKM